MNETTDMSNAGAREWGTGGVVAPQRRVRRRIAHVVLALTAVVSAFVMMTPSPASAVTVEGGCGANSCYRRWRSASGQVIDYAEIRRDPSTGRVRLRSCDYNNDGTTLGVRWDPSDGAWRTYSFAAPGTASDPCSSIEIQRRIRKFQFISAVQTTFPSYRITGSTPWQAPPWGAGPP